MQNEVFFWIIVYLKVFWLLSWLQDKMLDDIIYLNDNGSLGYTYQALRLVRFLAPVAHPLYNMYQASWRSVVVASNTSSLRSYKNILESINLHPNDFTPREISVIQSRITFLGDVIVCRTEGTSGQGGVPARIGHEFLDCHDLSDFYPG